jgi:hypothetical protein
MRDFRYIPSGRDILPHYRPRWYDWAGAAAIGISGAWWLAEVLSR